VFTADLSKRICGAFVEITLTIAVGTGGNGGGGSVLSIREFGQGSSVYLLSLV
jgi:NAD(P)H-hydrate repair Nnr-like enzyme with NAD(P)H-hydrate epimerase domain